MHIKKILFLALYYGIARYLPDSYTPVFGKLANRFRIFCVKHIVKKAGKIDTINRGVYFGNGAYVELGDHCTLGANCSIPNNTIVGNYSMISRQVHILHCNHKYENPNVPIKLQGNHPNLKTIIEDDVWIGMRSFLTPGRVVRKGTVVAACSVPTKDFEEYSIVGGNPAKIIKSRKKSFSEE